MRGVARGDWGARLAAVDVPKDVLARVVAEHLLKEGHVEAAQAFAAEAGPAAADACDPEAIACARRRASARSAIAGGDVMRAVEAAGGAEALGPELTFRLHRQRVIELACAGDSSGALEYAAEHLAPAAALDASGALLESLESAVSLVAFDDPRSSPMAELAGDAERRGVADALNAHMLRREGRGGADSAMQGLLRQIAYAEEKVCGSANAVGCDLLSAHPRLLSRADSLGTRRRPHPPRAPDQDLGGAHARGNEWCGGRSRGAQCGQALPRRRDTLRRGRGRC